MAIRATSAQSGTLTENAHEMKAWAKGSSTTTNKL